MLNMRVKRCTLSQQKLSINLSPSIPDHTSRFKRSKKSSELQLRAFDFVGSPPLLLSPPPIPVLMYPKTCQIVISFPGTTAPHKMHVQPSPSKLFVASPATPWRTSSPLGTKHGKNNPVLGNNQHIRDTIYNLANTFNHRTNTNTQADIAHSWKYVR
jgi:hypothetical protein